MNYKMLIIALIMCFSAANVFSLARKEDIKKLNADIDGLKKSQENNTKAINDLIDKLGKPQPNDPTRPDDRRNSGNLMPLTWETARSFEVDLINLNFYLSKSLNLTAKEQNNNYGVVKNGKIVDNNEKNLPEEKLVINSNTPVKIVKFSLTPKDKASIDIFISDQSALLKFTRNSKDYFKLDSVTKNTRNYPIDEEVLLCIYDERSQNNRNSVPRTGTTSSANRPQIPEDIMLRSGQYNYLTRDAVVKYLSENSRGVSERDIRAVIGHYIEESRKENINHDIAIAQMCYATQNLSDKTLFNNMNYGGLITTGAKLNGKNWNGKFPRSRTGVKAHIQHLKGYASTASLREAIVDPRFHLLANMRGKGDTIHKLSAYWVKNNQEAYERDIKEILEKLYSYQESYN
jgi:hypothetical protein